MSHYFVKVERRKVSDARYHLYKRFECSTIEAAREKITWILNLLFTMYFRIRVERINDSFFVEFKNEKMIISLCKF